jgi:tripartite-type tricarboxylate transporter receptor subunit TctC
VLSEPAYKSEMQKRTIDLDPGTPQEFRSWLEAERKKWSDLIQRINLKLG